MPQEMNDRHTRRGLLKGGLAGAGVVLAGPVIADAVASPAATSTAGAPGVLIPQHVVNGSGVTPFGRHLMFGRDPSTQMSVAWQVPVPVKKPFIRIGRSPYELDQQVEAEVRALATKASVVSPVDSVPPVHADTIEQYYLHANVSHLEPGATYYYAVGHQGLDPRHGFAAELISSFTTRPRSAGPFTFTAFGDQGVSYDAVLTGNLIAAQNPAFHLHAGDISYAESTGHGGLKDSYDPRVWDSWFNETDNVASHVPWMVAVGNHEIESWYDPHGYGGQLARFDFIGNGPRNCPVTYTFTYGNVAVLSLDVNDVSYELPANLFYSGNQGGDQANWLDQTLTGYRKRHDIDFIVIQFHHCAYCTCTSHGSEGGARQFWTSIFDKHGVDLVINGHNHIYERTDPLRAGKATKQAPIGATIEPATSGTTYITAGGAGNSLYSFGAADSYEGHLSNVETVTSFVNEPGQTKSPETVDWSRVRYTGYSLLAITSTPAKYHGGHATLTIRGLNEYGIEIDHLVLSR